MLQATTTDFKGDIKLHGYFGFLHEEPWLHNNEKVCEKVELYDLNEALCGRQPGILF